MRRIMMLTLLALTLPTAALANNFLFTTGTLMNFAGGEFQGNIEVGGGFISLISVAGKAPFDTITLSDLTLFRPVRCGPSTLCYPFPGGDVSVAPGGFGDTLTPGTVRVTNNSSGTAISITAGLSPFPGVKGGTTVLDATILFGGHGPVVLGGRGTVRGTFTNVPEPVALEGLLLGTGVMGLIGLAGTTKRKLKLGK